MPWLGRRRINGVPYEFKGSRLTPPLDRVRIGAYIRIRLSTVRCSRSEHY